MYKSFHRINQSISDRSSKYGKCARCNEDNTQPVWCLSCDPDKTTRWTSGDKDIDNCMKTFQLRTFTYEDAIEWIPFVRISDVKEIGKGGFGSVYSALWLDGIRKVNGDDYDYARAREPSCIVALKTLANSKESKFDFLKEFKSLMECRLNFSKLAIYGITQNNETKEFLMVFQFANNGNLYKYLRENFSVLTWQTKLQILKDISKELVNIHGYGFIHADFHSGNILQDQQSYMRSYIVDLRLSKKKDERVLEEDIYGVMPYVAPEVLLGKQHFTQAADIYGFGIIMAEVSTGQRPFDGHKFDAKLAVEIYKGLRPELALGTPKCYIELAEKCMDSDPQKRPNAYYINRTINNWLEIIVSIDGSEIKKQFSDEDKVVKSLPISKHPDEMYTSKIISTKLISKAIEDDYNSLNLIKKEAILKKNLVDFHKLNYGLVINSQKRYIATNRAFNSEPAIKSNIEKCHIKLTSPKDRKELFLLNNCINVSSFQSLPPKLVNVMVQSKNLFNNNNRSFNNFYFEADFPLVELNFERKTIKLTTDIKIAIDNALNSERPYNELIKVFNTFGYLLSLKIILGQKLRRSCILQKELDLVDLQIEFEENYSSELDKLFILWKDQYGFDEEYLMSINGKVVRKNDIEKWLNEHLKQDLKLLRIIGQSELVPLYELFEEPVRGNIKSILGIDNLPKILMTGVVQIIKNVEYYNVDFPSHLESSNYHIFAKVTRSNKYSFDVIDKAVVKIRSSNRTGFLAIIENFDEMNDLNAENLQIMWVLIGFPDEINFYSPHTRELSILSMETQDVDIGKSSVLISAPEHLPEESRIVLSFEYPLLGDYSRTQDGKIELKIDYNPYDNYDGRSEIYNFESGSEDDGVEDGSEDDGVECGSEDDDAESRSESDKVENGTENYGAEGVCESDEVESEYSNINTEYKIKYSLYSYIFIFNQEFVKADVSTSECKNVYLKAIGSLIS